MVAIRCDRKTRSWSCAPAARERRVEVVIADATQPATVVGSFPDAMSAGRARTIITTTATLAMKPDMPLPACSEGSDDIGRWHRSRFNPPSPDLEYPAAEVDIGGDGLIVDYGSLRFSLGTDDRPLCWDELIIVWDTHHSRLTLSLRDGQDDFPSRLRCRSRAGSSISNSLTSRSWFSARSSLKCSCARSWCPCCDRFHNRSPKTQRNAT